MVPPCEHFKAHESTGFKADLRLKERLERLIADGGFKIGQQLAAPFAGAPHFGGKGPHPTTTAAFDLVKGDIGIADQPIRSD